MSSILASSSPPSSRARVHLFPLSLLILLGVLSLFFISIATRTTLTTISQFFTKDAPATPPNQLGRTNLLLLGLSDPTKNGSDLTDVMLFISFHGQSGDIALVSLPRDIYLESEQLKLNAVFHSSPALTKSVVSRLVGQPVHYLATIDFSGFVKVIDIIGGVDITIDRTFDDYKFPIPGRETALPEPSRYEHLHFAAGPAHLDGITALKYVRSRHALGEEGTDFARNERQKKIVTAVKSRLASPDVLLNPKLLTSLIDQFTAIIHSDIPPSHFPFFLSSLLKATDRSPRSLDITALLSNPSPSRYSGQYVLVPQGGNWSQIQYQISCFLYPCTTPLPARGE